MNNKLERRAKELEELGDIIWPEGTPERRGEENGRNAERAEGFWYAAGRARAVKKPQDEIVITGIRRLIGEGRRVRD